MMQIKWKTVYSNEFDQATFSLEESRKVATKTMFFALDLNNKPKQ